MTASCQPLRAVEVREGSRPSAHANTKRGADAGRERSTTDDFKYKDRFYNADNQCERRVQANLIQGLEGEIETLRNLIDIERQVHSASADFLGSKAHSLSEEVCPSVRHTVTQRREGECEARRRLQLLVTSDAPQAPPLRCEHPPERSEPS